MPLYSSIRCDTLGRNDRGDGFAAESGHVRQLADRRTGFVSHADHVVADMCASGNQTVLETQPLPESALGQCGRRARSPANLISTTSKASLGRWAGRRFCSRFGFTNIEGDEDGRIFGRRWAKANLSGCQHGNLYLGS